MNLFQIGDFTLNSGRKAKWKIECDALTPEDWAALAEMAVAMLPPFGEVVGIPKGGIPFAEALSKYATPGYSTILLCDDVLTTGGSMGRLRTCYREPASTVYRPIYGVVAFARGECPPWIFPVFQMRKENW